jgi:hypothetical protein
MSSELAEGCPVQSVVVCDEFLQDCAICFREIRLLGTRKRPFVGLAGGAGWRQGTITEICASMSCSAEGRHGMRCVLGMYLREQT